MQIVSNAYKKSINQPFRNRAYVKGTIGIINSEAQNNAKIKDTKLVSWSDSDIFSNTVAKKLCATAEEQFSKVDGSFYFLDIGNVTGHTGAITEEEKGIIKFSLGDTPLDIKGLTIDFGDTYPEIFVVKTDTQSYTYTNNSAVFVSTDAYDGITEVSIIPQQMLDGADARLRIYSIQFGMVDTFGSDEVLECSISEEVSPIAESIPNRDVMIKLDNSDGLYSPDNDSSAAAYLELGQEIILAFGYDVAGDGNIEWLPGTKSYLKSWSATNTEASFTCTDLFDGTLDETYYKGLYSPTGKTLYQLAEEVLSDAGVPEENYYLDEYLKEVIVNNPVPAVKYSEALQLIANAGRCVLRDDRDGRIYIQSSFAPDVKATFDNASVWNTNKEKIFENNDTVKAYAVSSLNFARADGEMMFWADGTGIQSNIYMNNTPANIDGEYCTMGYVINPAITLEYERAFDAYGFEIDFVNTFPREFKVTAYHNGTVSETMICKPEDNSYSTSHTFQNVDKLRFEFTKGALHSLLFISRMMVNNVTDYDLEDGDQITDEPTATRTEKLRNLTTTYTQFIPSTTATEIASEDLELTGNTTHTFYFTDPSFNMFAVVEEDGKEKTAIKATVVESSNYYASVSITGVTKSTKVKVTLNGNYYTQKESNHTVNHQSTGNDVTWSNPLVSTRSHARDLNEWLSSYYLGKVEYDIPWRGDPRTDANDLFYYERADGTRCKIRAYQNDLSFNGGFSGTLKARMVIE